MAATPKDAGIVGQAAAGSAAAGSAAAWLAAGLSALDERLARARTEQFVVVRAAGETRLFAVRNGDGVEYTVDFRSEKTGACNCPDFERRGKSIATCKHALRVVIEAWPDRLDAYLDLVRAHIRAAVADFAARAGEAPQGIAEDSSTAEQAEDAQAPSQSRAADLDATAAIARAAGTRTLDAVMRLLEAALPGIVEKILEETFTRLMEQVPALVEGSVVPAEPVEVRA